MAVIGMLSIALSVLFGIACAIISILILVGSHIGERKQDQEDNYQAHWLAEQKIKTKGGSSR